MASHPYQRAPGEDEPGGEPLHDAAAGNGGTAQHSPQGPGTAWKATPWAERLLDDSEEVEEGPQAPADKFMLAYMIVVLLGMGTLFPWNALITVGDFFDKFYPDSHAEFTFPFIYNVPCFAFSIMMIGHSHWLSQHLRFYSTFITFGVCIQAFALIVLLRAEEHMFVTERCMIAIVALLGAAAAVATTTIFAIAAQFPPAYTQAVMTGQGVSGITIAVIRLATKAAFPSSRSGLRKSALVFFECAAAVIVVCTLSYPVLVKLPITKYFTQPRALSSVSSRNTPSPDSDSPRPRGQWTQIKQTIAYVWKVGLGVFLVFFFTLIVFPGLTVSVPSTLGLGDWYGLLLVSIFMVGDLLGRIVANWVVLCSEETILFWVLLRGVFVWFFLIPRTTSWRLPDALVMCTVLAMSMTNGYLGSLLMMFGPAKVPARLKPLAGVLMSCFLTLGILLGCALAYLLHLLL